MLQKSAFSILMRKSLQIRREYHQFKPRDKLQAYDFPLPHDIQVSSVTYNKCEIYFLRNIKYAESVFILTGIYDFIDFVGSSKGYTIVPI